MFAISSKAVRTQEWYNLARNDVSRLRLILLLESFIACLVVGAACSSS
jgi:hypothetical protein